MLDIFNMHSKSHSNLKPTVVKCTLRSDRPIVVTFIPLESSLVQKQVAWTQLLR